jgi:hypothetical protein
MTHLYRRHLVSKIALSNDQPNDIYFPTHVITTEDDTSTGVEITLSPAIPLLTV